MIGKYASAWPHVLLTILLFAFVSLGTGYRNLWPDEVETAERARLILAEGLPMTIDRQGVVSVNAEGKEIEEGRLHRYTPWLQFYTGALGLEIGDALQLPRDESIRLPFVAAHSLAMGMISFALASQLGAPVVVAVGIGAVLGLQTPRITQNRTARYHALLDFFVALGLLGLGALKNRKTWGTWLIAIAILCSFHAQTLGGAAVASGLAAATACCLFVDRKKIGPRKAWRVFLGSVVFPGLLSVALIACLTRPWLQGHWGHMTPQVPRNFFHPPTLLYAFLFAGLSTLILWRAKISRAAWTPALVSVVIIAVISFFDFHPFSQIRYYTATALIALLWPLYTDVESKYLNRFLIALLSVAAIAELGLGRATSRDLYWPFQGIHLVLSDWQNQQAGTQQPFREAMTFIRENSNPSDPVLIGYVPQYVNWYLPGHPVALMPSVTGLTPLNKSNPIWQTPLTFPVWQVFNLHWGPGAWDCDKACDFGVRDIDLKNQTYILFSKTMQREQKMCIVRSWMTSPHNNAPFELLKEEAFVPQGPETAPTVLAKACD